jgi:hypothetical protein
MYSSQRLHLEPKKGNETMPYSISMNPQLTAALEQLAQLACNLPCGQPPARPFTADDTEWKDFMRLDLEVRGDFDGQWGLVLSLVQGDQNYCLRTELWRALYRWIKQDPGKAPGQILVTVCENEPQRFAHFVQELIDPVQLARRHRLVAVLSNSFINPCYARTLGEIHETISRHYADDPDAIDALSGEGEQEHGGDHED